MRKILLILFVLISFISSAQKLQFDNTYGREFQRVQVDTLLGLPKDTFLVPATLQNIPFIANKAGSIYLWNIVTHVWDLFSSGGGDFWSLTGNAVAQDTSKFIGTTDSSEVALRFRVNNYNAGYIGYSYQTYPANPVYTADGNNHTGIVALGFRAADSLRKIIDGGGSVGGGSSVAIGSDALRDNSVAQNTAIGSNAMKRARTMVRNTVVGQGALQYSYTGSFNVGMGTFVMEVQDGVSGGTAIGMESQRGNKQGVGNTSVGGWSLAFGSAWVDAIAVTNGGSGYTTATVTISAPDLGTPGTSSVQATATATINSGAITAITLTNKGMGYSTSKTPLTVTITGDGTGATATATLRKSENNTAIGYVSSYFNQVGRRLTTVGAFSGYGLTSAFRTLVDDDMTLIGYNATRGDSRATSVPFINSTGVGSNVKVNCDSCFVLGPPEVSTTIGASTVNASAKLEITSTTKGFLPPRMSAAQRVAIASPATALFVWDSDSSRYMGYNGSTYKGIAWTDESGGGSTPTLQQVTTAGNSTTTSIISSSTFGFRLNADNGSTRARLAKTSGNGSAYLSLYNESSPDWEGQLFSLPLSADRQWFLPNENPVDTLATRAYARSVGGGGGGGDVTKVGTPSNHQLAIWTGDGTIKGNTLTGNRAVVTDADGEPIAATTTATEIGYVNGVTSAIQTQLDAKATGSITQNWFDDDLTLNGVTTKINRADFFDDMLTTSASASGTSYMLELVSGTGADASIGGTVAPPNGDGWATMSSGTTTTGAASLASTSTSSASGTKNKIDTTKTYRFETNVQIETLADGTDRFRFGAGLMASNTNTTGTDMIWFRYSDDVNSGNWTCYSADGTTTESTSSGVAAAAGTTVRLGFEYDNAQIRFYINGSLVATHTTRLPEHNSQSMFPVLNVTKSLGTTNRNVFIDYVKYRRL